MSGRARGSSRRPRHLGISPEEQYRHLLPVIRLIGAFTDAEKEILLACVRTAWDIPRAASICGKTPNRVHNVIRKLARKVGEIGRAPEQMTARLDTREAFRTLGRTVGLETSRLLLPAFRKAPMPVKLQVLSLLFPNFLGSLRKSVTE